MRRNFDRLKTGFEWQESGREARRKRKPKMMKKERNLI
jgi:hypothetical protein